MENESFTGRKQLLWHGQNMKITNFEPANQFVRRKYRGERGRTLRSDLFINVESAKAATIAGKIHFKLNLRFTKYKSNWSRTHCVPAVFHVAQTEVLPTFTF